MESVEPWKSPEKILGSTRKEEVAGARSTRRNLVEVLRNWVDLPQAVVLVSAVMVAVLVGLLGVAGIATLTSWDPSGLSQAHFWGSAAVLFVGARVGISVAEFRRLQAGDRGPWVAPQESAQVNEIDDQLEELKGRVSEDPRLVSTVGTAVLERRAALVAAGEEISRLRAAGVLDDAGVMEMRTAFRDEVKRVRGLMKEASKTLDEARKLPRTSTHLVEEMRERLSGQGLEAAHDEVTLTREVNEQVRRELLG